MPTTERIRWSLPYAIASFILLLLISLPVLFWTVEVWLEGALGGGAAGLLTLPLCLVLAWLATRRAEWDPHQPDRVGAETVLALCLVPMGLGFFWSANTQDALFITGLVLPVAFWAWFWGTRGYGMARALTFPFAFSWFTLPYEHFLRFFLDHPLQVWTADIAVMLLKVIGYPTQARSDVTFFSSEYWITVNETCSGMNMLVSLAMYTLIFGWITQPSPRYRMLLVALIMPVSMLANGVRVAAIYLMGHHGGKALADGFWHTGSAYLIFLPIFWFIYVANNALTRRWVRNQNSAADSG